MNTVPHRSFVAFFASLAVVLSLAGRARGTTVYLNELMANNQTGIVDEDGSHSDWLELWNSGTTTVSLNGWYLTDDAGDLSKWQFPATTPAVTLAAGARLVVYCSAKDRKAAANRLHTNFKLNKSGNYLALVHPDGLTVEHEYAPAYPQQVQDVAYGLPVQTSTVTLVAPGASGRALVPQSAADMPTGAAGWNSIAYNDSAWQAGATGFGYDTTGSYGTLIGAGGDLQTAMYLHNSTALVRIPFTASNVSSITALVLKMKYDDGFTIYLNGVVLAQSLSGGTNWNSGALIDHNGALTLSGETFNPANPTNALAALVNGTNVLAIQMLNYTNGTTQDVDSFNVPNGSRALCLPQLDATVVSGIGAATYLTTATPGAVNSAASTALGPAVSQATNSVAVRPTGNATSAPITITAKVTTTLKALNATNPVKLFYRVMFNAESNVVMKDDGIAPDLIAGDKIYTALLPTVNAGTAQMIRWRVEAKDTSSVAGTDPPYRNTTDNDQYYGTVTADGITTSQLPILHWFLNPSFVTPTYLPGTAGGCRCSFFYVERLSDGTYAPGRFYDNVQVDLHGQSTSGFPTNKKSHDVNFSQDNQFNWKTGERAVASFNLLTNYADKTRVRNNMAYETWAGSGHVASHFSIPLRVQQNGVFWAIYDLTENGNNDFLKRTGLDENGALYKIYDTLSDGGSSAEKKTGQPITDKSDLSNFENALNTANALAGRRQYGFDNVDIPSLVNHLAVSDLIANNDQGHKNFYMYRDTFGTAEWSVLPWDQDLSFGHTWTGAQNYFDDDIDAQRPLQDGANNRLKQLVWDSPELTQMYVRRLRTLMDKYLVSAVATTGPWETRINQVLDQLDPAGQGSASDAYQDMTKWGYWVDGSSTPTGIGSVSADHNMRSQAARILTSNPNPPYPSANPYAAYGYSSIPAFLPGRRQFLYTMNPTTSIAPTYGTGIPTAQAAVPTGLVFEQIDYNPASGNPNQEYFILRNNSGASIDISGWKVTGAVNYTFRGGTVIPPFTSGSAFTATGDVHAGRLHLARLPAQFRARTTSPKGNEYRLVMGPYDGQLSARGETINLIIPGATPTQDVVVATTTYPGTPTASQNSLRVTELNYAPSNPTPAETAALPGVQAGDFEFIELMNTGATTLSLSGAQFDRGITFVFPASYTLAVGARIVLVSNQAAFQLRCGNTANIAGVYEGNFDNNGERVRLLDSVGEEVLDFTYDPAWYPPTNGAGYTLVTRLDGTAWDQFDNPLSWAISGTAGGTPNAGNASGFSQVYEGWRHGYFTALQEADQAIAGLNADPDNDLDTNFYEYAFGTNPQQASGHQTPESLIFNDAGTNYAAVRFVREKKALDMIYTVEVNSDLDNIAGWTVVNLPVGTPQDLGNGLERVTYRDSQPAGTAPRYFRVRAVK